MEINATRKSNLNGKYYYNKIHQQKIYSNIPLPYILTFHISNNNNNNNIQQHLCCNFFYNT
jgi:hypothetical protein